MNLLNENYCQFFDTLSNQLLFTAIIMNGVEMEGYTDAQFTIFFPFNVSEIFYSYSHELTSNRVKYDQGKTTLQSDKKLKNYLLYFYYYASW